MHKKILEVSTINQQWKEGYISHEDTHCFVTCDCGEDLSISDYKIFECPKCGKGYITEFLCYRVPADAMCLLTGHEMGASNKCAHNVLDGPFYGFSHCYICGSSAVRC